jgi:hypothetical protein
LRLLKAAEATRWPVRRLEQEVLTIRKALPHSPGAKGGRKPPSRLMSISRTLDSCAAAVNALIDVQEPGVDHSPESARRLIDALHRLKRACSLVEERVRIASPHSTCGRGPSEHAESQNAAPTLKFGTAVATRIP